MSQENVEIVRRMYEEARDAYYRRIEALHEAHESGDFGEFLDAADERLHPDFVLTPPEDSPFQEAGTREWRGREGFLRFVAGQSEGFDGCRSSRRSSSTQATAWWCHFSSGARPATPASRSSSPSSMS